MDGTGLDSVLELTLHHLPSPRYRPVTLESVSRVVITVLGLSNPTHLGSILHISLTMTDLESTRNDSETLGSSSNLVTV